VHFLACESASGYTAGLIFEEYLRNWTQPTEIVRGQQTTTFSQTCFKCTQHKTVHFAILLTEDYDT